MTGISFLGTGSYADTRYQFKDKSCKTSFFPVAMKEILRVDRLSVIMTKEAQKKHADTLAELIEYDPVIIPSGTTEAEYYEMFEEIVGCVPAGEHLMLDVTHGFRTQPMLALSAIIYLKYLKDAEIAGIYYGAYNPESPDISPVFELTPFVDVIDWTFAIRRFKEKGDATEMAELMEKLHTKTYLEQSSYQATELRTVGNRLQRLMQALSVIRPLEVMDESKRIQKNLPAISAELKEIYQTKPLAIILNDLMAELDGFNAVKDQDLFSKDGLQLQMTMIRHSLDVGRYQQALTLCTELLFSVACIKKNIDPLGNMRGELSRRLTAIGNNMGAVHQPYDDWEADLANIVIKATEYRNDLNHAGMRKEPKPSKNIIEMATTIKNETEQFLQTYVFNP